MNSHERAVMIAAVGLDFPLDGPDRGELDAHLAACLACRAAVARLREDADRLHGIASVDPAPQLRLAFAAAVRRPTRIGVAVLDDLRPWLRLAVVAALVAALVAGLVAVASVGSHGVLPGPDAVATPSGGPADPARVAGLAGRDERVCAQPTGLRIANGAVYVVCSAALERVALSGEPAARIEAGIAGAAPFGPDVWAVGPNALSRLDSMSLTVRVTSAAAGGDAIALDPDAIWVLRIAAEQLIRVDPMTLAVVATVPVGHNPADVLDAFGHVWVSNRDDATVSEIDPGTSRVVSTVHVGFGPAGLAASNDAVWVANDANGSVSRIDPASGRVATILVAPAIRTNDLPAIAASGSTVWVADRHTEQIAEIDDATTSIRRWIAPPVAIDDADAMVAMAVSGRSVWIVDSGSLLQEVVLP